MYLPQRNKYGYGTIFFLSIVFINYFNKYLHANTQCMHNCLYVVHVCMYVWMYVCMNMHVCVCMYKWVWECVFFYVRACVRALATSSYLSLMFLPSTNYHPPSNFSPNFAYLLYKTILRTADINNITVYFQNLIYYVFSGIELPVVPQR